MIDIFVPNVVAPKTTHQSKNIVKFGKFTRLADSGDLNNAKDFWRMALAPQKPPIPIDTPVAIRIEIAWPYRASEPKKNRNGRIFHTSKPDCSNMAKTIEDRLVELGYIKDDNLVVELIVRKYWDATGWVRIAIFEKSERGAA